LGFKLMLVWILDVYVSARTLIGGDAIGILGILFIDFPPVVPDQ